jgi:alpha-beta hydrolase superfamily lysophospholipase
MAIGGVVLLAAGAVLLWGWWASGLLLRGDRDPLTTRPETFGFPYRDETFCSADGVPLRAWFVPAPHPTDVTLVLCHGGAPTAPMCLSAPIFSGRAAATTSSSLISAVTGKAVPGRTSLSRYEIDDLRAALAHVRFEHPREAARVGIFAMSMGGALALWAAADEPAVAALAAESPFPELGPTVLRYGRLFHHTPPFVGRLALWFARQRLGFDFGDYAPIKAIGRIAPRPVFLIQGDRDRRIPRAEGDRLFAAAREPKTQWTVPGADHGKVAEVAGRAFQDRLLAFFNGAFGR